MSEEMGSEESSEVPESADNERVAFIRQWAYSDAPDPIEEDWEVIVAADAPPALLLELALDNECPRRHFFLDCLYLLAYGQVRHDPRSARNVVGPVVERAGQSDDLDVRRWEERTRLLLMYPETLGSSYMRPDSDWPEGRTPSSTRRRTHAIARPLRKAKNRLVLRVSMLYFRRHFARERRKRAAEVSTKQRSARDS